MPYLETLITKYLPHQRPFELERPLFIVAGPRAGASLLSQLLSEAERVYMLDSANRQQMETLTAAGRSPASDRLTAAEATAELIAELNPLVQAGLRGRRGESPKKGQARLVDQVGVNALRIPFLSTLFPEAQFIYLYRKPVEHLARIIEAWRSGRFVTYPELPGWPGPAWSLPLIPGWPELRDKTIGEIAAAQWAVTTAQILDDLSQLPAGRWCAVSYGDLLADLPGQAQELGRFAGLRWSADRPGQAPLAHHRAIDSWRQYRAEAEMVYPLVEVVAQRALRLYQARRPTLLNLPAKAHHARLWSVTGQPARRTGRHRGFKRRVSQAIVAGALVVVVISPVLPAPEARAATFTVTNLDDAGVGSLRQAIEDANAAAGPDIIDFQAGLTGQIGLTSGQLIITDSLDIQGPGADTIAVNANNASRVFYLYNGGSLLDITISGLTITGGSDTIGGGIINFDENLTLDGVRITGNTAAASLNEGGDGGGLWADGFNMNLTIRNSEISGNTASNDGGGMYVEDTGGPLLIQNTRITGNNAGESGGGIYFYDPDDSTTIENSTISGNTAGDRGGGIYLYDTDGGIHTIRNTTISGNNAIRGGGVFLYGPDQPMVIENSTISGNEASIGGGVYIYDPYNDFTIQHTTIAGNLASEVAGGVFAGVGPVIIDHTIAADNTSGFNTDLGNGGDGSFDISFSLVESVGTANINDNGGNILSQDPQLGPLQDNGGPTQTHLPAATSLAVDGGDPGFAAPPAFDQRGLDRVFAGRIDMGAVERTPGTLQFSLTGYTVNENGAAATITVTRLGGSGAVSADFATGDGAAVQPGDYNSATGTLTWPAGDLTPKSFQVDIVDDSITEANETVNLALSNPQGEAILGRVSNATLTIIDNEGAAGPIYLPIVMSGQQSGLPDLIVEQFQVSSNTATVVIANVGSGPANDSFWVDLYINPNPPPTAVNQIWDDGRSSQGIAWGITEPVDVSERITLTLTSPYLVPGHTNFPGDLPAGTAVYAQVDSVNYTPGVTVGGVLESHEANAGPYNNIANSLSVAGTDPLSPPQNDAAPAGSNQPPPRQEP